MQSASIISFLAKDNTPWASAYADIITRLCRAPEGDGLNRQDVRDWIAKDVICHIAVNENTQEVLGGVAVKPQPGGAEFIGVVVDPDHRQSGIGHRMLDRAIADGRTRGFGKILLDIRLTDEGLHEGAYQLYYRHGFRLIPGVKITPIRWNFRTRHLWRNADPGGVFRSRIMELKLFEPDLARPERARELSHAD